MIRKVLLYFFHHSDSTALLQLQCNSTKHPCKLYPLIIQPLYRTLLYCWCMCRIWWYKWSCNLLLKEFTDIVITDITAWQENWCFVEIGHCTLYPLYDKWKYWYACLIWLHYCSMVDSFIIVKSTSDEHKSTFTVVLAQSFDYLTNILAGSYSWIDYSM